MREYVVDDAVRKVGFTGALIAEVSTNMTGRRPRWTELKLFRMISADQAERLAAGEDPEFPAGDYLLHSRGPTRVFHRRDGGCGKGSPAPLSAAMRPPAACETCWPPAERWPADGDRWPDDPDDLSPDDMVRVESDRPQAVRCATPDEVVTALRETSSGRSRLGSDLSIPAKELLIMAARKDAAFAANAERVDKLTP